ncbi:hypothetical protein HDU93_010068, partial [Gonapodya sp. JEL0774]
KDPSLPSYYKYHMKGVIINPKVGPERSQYYGQDTFPKVYTILDSSGCETIFQFAADSSPEKCAMFVQEKMRAKGVDVTDDQVRELTENDKNGAFSANVNPGSSGLNNLLRDTVPIPMATIQLPYDVLRIIIQYVVTCPKKGGRTNLDRSPLVAFALVCRTWNEAAEDVLYGKLRLGQQIGPQGAVGLAQGLEASSSIAKLLLAGNLIGDAGCVAVCKALQRNHSLEELNLRTNKLGRDSMWALSNLLKRNTSLNSLCVTGNNCEVNILMDGLKSNSTLKKLYVDHNVIQPGYELTVGAALGVNTGLEHLVMWGTELVDNGVCALACALTRNRSLKQLEIGGIRNDGAQALTSALLEGCGLKKIWIFGHPSLSSHVQQELTLAAKKAKVEIRGWRK